MAYSGGASGNNAAFRVNEKSDEIAENEYFIHQASAYAMKMKIKWAQDWE